MKSEDWNLANARVTVLGIPRKADTVFSGSVRLTKRSRGESSSESSVATSVNLMDVDASHSIPKLPLPSEDEILVQVRHYVSDERSFQKKLNHANKCCSCYHVDDRTKRCVFLQ
jgi:hypothetical protein